jgi:hypothetical protein
MWSISRGLYDPVRLTSVSGMISIRRTCVRIAVAQIRGGEVFAVLAQSRLPCKISVAL